MNGLCCFANDVERWTVACNRGSSRSLIFSQSMAKVVSVRGGGGKEEEEVVVVVVSRVGYRS